MHLGGGAESLLFSTARTSDYYGPSRFLALDPATGAVRLAGEAGSGLLWGTGIVAADVDGDGVDEASGLAAPFIDTYLFAVDLLGDAVDWSSPVLAPPEYGWGTAVTHADVNGDGAEELVAFPDELVARPSSQARPASHRTRSATSTWTETACGKSSSPRTAGCSSPAERPRVGERRRRLGVATPGTAGMRRPTLASSSPGRVTHRSIPRRAMARSHLVS